MPSSPQPLVVVQPRSGWSALNLKELWEYRELLVLLAGRDVRLRYKQTVLGVLWVVLQPLAAALLFTAVFGHFAHLPSEGRPYGLFVFAGLLPWMLISGTVQRAATSLLVNERLISKVYFPRLLIPISSAGAVLIDFCVSLLVAAAWMAIAGVAPTARILALPLFLLFALVSATGISLWLAALNVRYRDFVHALPFLIQIWMFASPVAYSTSLVPARLQPIFALNPAVGAIAGFRWCLLDAGALSAALIAPGLALSIAILATGAYVFRRVERGFADAL